MLSYEEEFCGLKLHPCMGFTCAFDLVEERTLDTLMELTDVHKFYSRSAISEFIKRLILIQDIPLNFIVDRFYNEDILFELNAGIHHLTLSSRKLDDLIGLERKMGHPFDYTGKTEDFLGMFDRKHLALKLTLPKTFKLRAETYRIPTLEIRNAEIVANVITDQLNAYNIEKIEGSKPFQFARTPIKTDYYDLYLKTQFNPYLALSNHTMKKWTCLTFPDDDYTTRITHDVACNWQR